MAKKSYSHAFLQEEMMNLKSMESLNNYSQWIFDSIKDYFGKNVLEIGSGLGVFAEYLHHKHYHGIEINPVQLQYLKKKFKRYPQLTFSGHDIVTLNPKSFKQDCGNFDTVICINVLEHIQQDEQALRHMYDLLAPGGNLILFVPALKSIYGTVDQADHHFRRYNKHDLCQKIHHAKLIITQQRYFNFFGIFGWYLHGKILRTKIHPITHLSSFNAFVPLLRNIENLIPIPLGLSLLTICKKPTKQSKGQ